MQPRCPATKTRSRRSCGERPPLPQIVILPRSATTTCTRGVPACIRRVAGSATPTGSAGHAGAVQPTLN